MYERSCTPLKKQSYLWRSEQYLEVDLRLECHFSILNEYTENTRRSLVFCWQKTTVVDHLLQ